MNNEMNYVPNIVDIEGLQGMNSSQGMENIMQDLENMDSMYGMNEDQNSMWPPVQGMDYMYNMPPMSGMDDMYNMPPMPGMDHMGNMGPMPGMDHMGNMGSMPGMDNMNGYNMQGGSCAEVISCMATMCYMMSVFFTQMLQGGNSMGMYPIPMKNCDCMQYNNTMDNEYGYPPIY